MNADCRYLVRFVAGAERMYATLGYADVDDFIQRGLELDAEDVAIAVAWLKKNRPNEPIPFETVKRLAQQGRPWDALRDDKGRYVKGKSKGDNIIFGQYDGDRRSAEARADQGAIGALKRRGTDPAYIKARLERDGHHDLLTQVRTGEMSAYAAGKAAGFIKPPTPYEQILRLLPKLTPEERAQLAELLREGA